MSAGINKYLLEIEKELPSSSMKDCVAQSLTRWSLVARNLKAVRKQVDGLVEAQVTGLLTRRDQILGQLAVTERDVEARVKGFEDVLSSESFPQTAREQIQQNRNLEPLQRQSSRLNTLLRNLQDEVAAPTTYFRFEVSEDWPATLSRLGDLVTVPSFTPYNNRIEVTSQICGVDCGEQYTDLALCPRTGNVYIAGPGIIREYRGEDNTSVRKFCTEAKQPSITVNSHGHVLIADAETSKVFVYSAGGELLATHGGRGTGDGQFDSPRGLACDAGGRVFVADTGNRRVCVFDKDFKLLRHACKGVVNKPVSVTVTNSNDLIVTDESKVFVFESKFRLVRGFGDEKSLPLSGPLGLHVDSDGFILVGNNGSEEARVEVYTQDGSHHASLCDPNKPGCGAAAVTVDREGRIFTLDHRQHTVSIF